jgi:hypothetical protein
MKNLVTATLVLSLLMTVGCSCIDYNKTKQTGWGTVVRVAPCGLSSVQVILRLDNGQFKELVTYKPENLKVGEHVNIFYTSYQNFGRVDDFVLVER